MLTKLTLRNFKSFEYAEFDLGPVTTLIGTNASGKSNVRDALRILHGIARGYTLAEAIGEKWEQGVSIWNGIRGGTREMVFLGNKDKVCELCIGFSAILDEDAEKFLTKVSHQLVSGSICGEYRIVMEIEQKNLRPLVRSESFVVNGLEKFGYRAVMDDDGTFRVYFGNKQDAYNKSRIIRGMPVINQVGKLPVNEEIFATYLLTSTLTKLLEKMRFLDVSPDSMRQPSLPGQTVLSDRGENLSSVLHAICEDEVRKTVLLEWMKELTPQDVTDFSFSEDQQGKVLLGLQESDGRVISAYSASDGTLRFLAMIAALLSPEPARLYFFEEVENGIHPSRLHLLMQLIEERSTFDNGQLIMSTHSPQLLSYLSESSRKNASLIYRPSISKSSHAIQILNVPHINEVLQTQDVSEIHASGWFENVMEFMAGDEEEEREA